jgi:hypothetical protein
MKVSVPLVALAAALAAGPAAADAPPAGWGRSPHSASRPLPPRYAPPPPRLGHRHAHHHRQGGYRIVASGPSYGALPPFFAGMGDAADHLYGAPVRLTLYREAYIGRGLIYNTPPTLDVPNGGAVLSVRY